MSKIFIVEDETIVALELERAIKEIGFELSGTANNYNRAINAIKENQPDIILLDINLEKSKDGIEIAKTVQENIANIPIIYLTAFCDDATLDRAIETNPLGYLVKPFKRDDLKSILKLASYKRKITKPIQTTLISIGYGYIFDDNNQRLFFNAHPIKLSQKEKILLTLLVKAQGELVPFSTIEEYVWDGNIVSESAIRTLLYRLRGKLEYKIIETIPSFGLRIIATKC